MSRLLASCEGCGSSVVFTPLDGDPWAEWVKTWPEPAVACVCHECGLPQTARVAQVSISDIARDGVENAAAIAELMAATLTGKGFRVVRMIGT